MNDDGLSYTVMDGQLLKVPTEIDADAGFRPFGRNVSVSFGEHLKADPLRSLDVRTRALARVSVGGDAYFHPGEQA